MDVFDTCKREMIEPYSIEDGILGPHVGEQVGIRSITRERMTDVLRNINAW